MPNRNNRIRRRAEQTGSSNDATGNFLSNVNMSSDPNEIIQATSQGMMEFMQQAMENMNMNEEDMVKGLQVPTATPKVMRQVMDLPLVPLSRQQIWFAHLATENTHEGSWNTCTVWLVTKEHGSNGEPVPSSDGLSFALYMGKHLSTTSRRTDAHDLVRDAIAQCCLDPKGGLMASMTSRLFPPKGTLKTAFPPQRPTKILVDSQGILEYLKQDVIDNMGIPELGVAEAALVQSASTGATRTINYGLDHIVPDSDDNVNNVGQIAASTLLATDYVNEEPAPFQGWEIPGDAINMPRHWFIRPPRDLNSYRLTDLWGWRTNLERAIIAGDWAFAGQLVEAHDPEEIREFLEIRILLTKMAQQGLTKNCSFLLDRCGVAVDGMQAPNSPQKWKAMQIDAGGEGVTTPLHRASYHGFADTVQFLLERGASVHAIDEMGPAGTPLHHAVSQGHADCVRILCQHGSSLSYKTPKGFDAMLLSKNMAAGQQPNVAHGNADPSATGIAGI